MHLIATMLAQLTHSSTLQWNIIQETKMIPIQVITVLTELQDFVLETKTVEIPGKLALEVTATDCPGLDLW